MDQHSQTPLPLAPYRALDLTSQNGMICGRVLGDLGANVIKVEPPGGDRSRNIEPFYHNDKDPEKSLHWFCYNANKRGITLNLETKKGRSLLKNLVERADFLIESFPPGYLQKLGLDYSVLSRINPGIILVSITPFGQTGPYRDYKSADIVAMAMGGLMYVTGDPDRPPVRVSVKQSPLHAGMQAAIGALLALAHRTRTGVGQQVDVSVQESIIPTIPEMLPQWEFDGYKLPRSGSYVFRGAAWQRVTWPCKDGQIGMRILTGVYAKAIIPLVEWMDTEGMAGHLKNVDWEGIDVGMLTQAEYDSWEDQFIAFFATHTKAELYNEALKRGIHLLPAYAPDELLKDRQLLARDYWQTVDHPELDTKITYPGPFVRMNSGSPDIKKRAPLIGEHNTEIYSEMGLTQEELNALKKEGVI